MLFTLTCLLVGIATVVIGCLLFYLGMVILSKIANILDIGCGCLGFIIIGFIVLVILGFIFGG